MILHGPGSEYYKGEGEYSRQDNRVYDYLGNRGELMLPYYRYMTVWKDLYTVYGGTLDWAHDALGMIAFTNELWSSDQFYNEAWTDSAAVPDEMQQLFYSDRLGMGAWYKDWTPFDHPELGPVEIGGWSKWYGRTTPPFMLQELVHRNTMFALFHADEMPLLEWGDVTVERIAGSTYRVKAEIRNTRAIPTRIEAAELYSSGEPDRFSISGSNVRVQAGGFTTGELSDQIRLQDNDPNSIVVNGGVQGRTSLSVTWIITGSGTANIEYRSQKGGVHSRQVQLR
jgi:hypothetical protein